MGKSKSLKISVLMVDGSFRERFHMIDYLNKQSFPKKDYEMIWVEFYKRVSLKLTKKKNLQIITLNNKKDKPYHSSFCFNEGIRRSRGRVLVIIDADQAVGKNFLQTIWQEHKECKDLVMYMQRQDELKKDHQGSKSYKIKYLRKVCRLTNPTNYGGCLTVRKKWLLKVNGYEQDPLFSGLHANGKDLYTRFKNLGLKIKWHPSELTYHPWHPGTRVPSDSYTPQLQIIRKRDLNKDYLPNYGLYPKKDKAEKDRPFRKKQNKKISRQNQELIKLKDKIKQQKKTIETITDSTSWKITAPFRKIISFIR